MQAELVHSQIPVALIACYQTGVELPLRIRELRNERGMTLADLAGKVGVSAPHISEIERGKKNLNNHLLVRLAMALHVAPAELIQGDAGKDISEIMNDLSHLSPRDLDRVRDFARALVISSPDDERTEPTGSVSAGQNRLKSKLPI
jgi:transcriptional regulator with XRE-family HTH domain